MAGAGHEHALAMCVVENLEKQHDWTCLEVHAVETGSRVSTDGHRYLVRGLPPRRLYVHPDEQIRILRAERDGDTSLREQATVPEPEWVLPVHTAEKWTLADFAAIFDAIDMPPARWPGYKGSPERHKRFLLAGVDFDSTIVYYLVHDGIVKPRQN